MYGVPFGHAICTTHQFITLNWRAYCPPNHHPLIPSYTQDVGCMHKRQ